MSYTPNPYDTTQPTEDKFVVTAAAEFRALKALVASLLPGAAYAGAWSALTGPLAAGMLVAHVNTVWLLLTSLADVTTSEPGVTADWVDISGVKRSGDTMTGPLSVPAGASGAQVPQAQEIGALANTQLTTHYKRSNILGTVSQSGGVPTGAIIERGSNANGEYIRWADGTQICTHSVTTSASGAVVWTFPASFSATPRIYGHAQSSTAGVFSTTAFPGVNAVEVHGWIHDGSRFVSANYMLAVGRWF